MSVYAAVASNIHPGSYVYASREMVCCEGFRLKPCLEPSIPGSAILAD